MSTSFADEPKPEPSNGGGSGYSCFLYGCLIAFLAMVVLAVVGGVVSYRFVTGTLEQYTADAPADLPKVTVSKEELAAIEDRVEVFQETIKEGGTPTDLVLTADEINALISKDEALNGRVYVTIQEGQVSGELSIPMDFMPLGKGRYFNASATFDVSLDDGVLIVTLAGAEVKGKEVPPQVIEAMSKENLAKEVYKNPEAARSLRRFESLTIEDDRIVLKPRPLSPNSDDATPMAEKPAESAEAPIEQPGEIERVDDQPRTEDSVP